MNREIESLRNEYHLKESDNTMLETNYNKLKNDFNDKQNTYIKREQELQQTVKKQHNQLDAVRDKELKYDS